MRKRTGLSLATTAAAAAILLAACGSDSNTSNADSGAATTAAPATTAPMTSAAAKDIVDTAVGAGSFKTLASLLTSAGLVDTLKGAGPFTVFAPTDEAFAKVPKDTLDKLAANKEALTKVLTYHVIAGKVMAADVKPGMVKTVAGDEATIKVDGGKVMIDGANVTQTDIAASNGVIHVIDSVILPKSLDLGGGSGNAAPKDIVDTAVAAGSFSTLATALKEAGLIDTLKGSGPFTVFAPTDEAFAKVPKETLDKLLANKDALTKVLTYHVVPGKVMAADVKAGPVKTVEGAEATIKVDGGKVMIDNANVVKTDVAASNGVIHVIDAVILPPGLNL